ncbi:helix-turn-helix transcriptional regulator [Paenibacillus massiliensis]|uniref:helix-turn-helix transcriptional regulator n=1 Tax=Paenibacillus massiliensis TaxID=225917 RepID=UPI00040532FE|nr:YafY family protein [Paenibacillus massiliensis]
MNKTERQLAITLELQRSKMLRAEDLAAQFETSVRTIYRDIQALSEAGVPIFGTTGQGYSLLEGYFLPPIGFTTEEAVALLMGTDFMDQRLDADFASVAQSVRRKIEAVLPEPVRVESRRIRETMRLIHVDEPITGRKEKDYLTIARHAIMNRRKLSFGYVKKMSEADGNRKSWRKVDPYGLALVRGHWTLIAHCNFRQELRHFRLSRMTELTLLEEGFAFPTGFDLNHYRPPDDRHVIVVVRVNRSMIDKILESGSFYMEAMVQGKDEIRVTFRVRQAEELLPYILGLGGNIEVLEPKSFRERVRQEIEKMFKYY